MGTERHMPRPLQAVLFDWDGTLIDSAEATFRCYRDLFARYGLAFDRRRFEATYAPDWYETYRAVGLPPAVWPEADAAWLVAYSARSPTLVDGARETLAVLGENDLVLGLVTSGSRERVNREVAALGLDKRFHTLVCSGEARRPKPAPDPLLLALEHLGVSAAAAAYVGDSPEDVRMARDAAVYSVGIPGGFPNHDTLKAARPDFLAASLLEAQKHLLGEGR